MTDRPLPLRILGIDTSCDDTGVGIVELTPDGRVTVLANRVWSQAVHAQYGGVMPELASREHVERIDQIMEGALHEAGLSVTDIGAVAATSGPGLVGALLVGLMYGKGLAQALNVPFHAAHHLEGHIFAAASEAELRAPFLALVVSGGHTHLFDVPRDGEYMLVGATRDDAAGEAFDKVARLAGLGYPGGPAISEAATRGDPNAVPFKEPLKGQSGFDFSFSGLKTAALLAHRAGATPENLAASFQRAAVQTLVNTTVRAAEATGRTTVVVSGGVAANRALRDAFATTGLHVVFPGRGLNTDNGAMIALAGAAAIQAGRPASALDGGATAYAPLANA
ncbi:tRNA (adenosine(37)-N6)-threonylcarbamoyltransferase complex transferase subunit TsaD [Deinococcus soli (ex Cha et al. 2016)]|uniref:tRNA N6-adenosine threonylcarbamoyltransferase n=2 Tax=Deinococcus soli (ex Cha et al. 2016) TaxID=1309411 RepID=A0A0F7JT72_9DEIO|nr:tRNA (adenosine(37)-N6)-threonylcarbamoyltransferase complex transferase subunit TsaD [Deinococcus soli (ex Cha et al. 2016)]AKH17850.1 O-sialoglycoprotein endopeptidase [Deinococcus soli (ex Cha et al. 2016)]MDR6220271.1 N6-L-threonylcarbamoyladenine synthase [Deinococcus soli (ex Cha et al. 2016)]MDR6330126.1 N6-L-threonylcarbamoyladenine synthase [Deinococcus soli (ex Cha et al. 2016)]MDR6752922.1 N6-L-threonylcarbamoyladenine synthase [Deinococcus soli (ex Cha et al. 2016)]